MTYQTMANLFIKTNPILIIDIEHLGNKNKHPILAIAAAVIHNGALKKTFYVCIKLNSNIISPDEHENVCGKEAFRLWNVPDNKKIYDAMKSEAYSDIHNAINQFNQFHQLVFDRYGKMIIICDDISDISRIDYHNETFNNCNPMRFFGDDMYGDLYNVYDVLRGLCIGYAIMYKSNQCTPDELITMILTEYGTNSVAHDHHPLNDVINLAETYLKIIKWCELGMPNLIMY
jgi:hypothetical protein